MFKYTAKKQIVKRITRDPFNSHSYVGSLIGPTSSYEMIRMFIKNYKHAEIYSNKPLKTVTFYGYDYPVSLFLETEV
jgi:hypothetical protein